MNNITATFLQGLNDFKNDNQKSFNPDPKNIEQYNEKFAKAYISGWQMGWYDEDDIFFEKSKKGSKNE